MKTLFLDTSAFLAVLFHEPGSSKVAGLMRDAEQVYASGLLEAEVRGAGSRKGLPIETVDNALTPLSLFQPDRALTTELKSVLAVSPRLRGADSWHLACALYLAGDPSAFPFLTLDDAQAQAASRLGFKVLPGEMAPGGLAREPQTAYKVRKGPVKNKKRKRT